MKLHINIQFIEEKDHEFVNVEYAGYDPDEEDLQLELYLHQDTNFEEFIKKDNIIKLIRKSLDDYSYDIETFKYSLESTNKLLDTDLNIPNMIERVYLDFGEETVKYLENNKLLLNYPITLNGEFEINHEDYNEVYRLFKDYPQITLYISGNTTLVTIEEYGKTVDAIDKIVSFIKKQDLSPVEQTMLAYDLVRDRVYQKEAEGETYETSRDLTSVLLGEKIVCVGYSAIFSEVLNNLGIKNTGVNLIKKDDPTKGHRRNLALVKDDKYNEETILYFDTTWDSKNNENDISYLNSYRYFALDRKGMDIYSQDYNDETFAGFTDGLVWEFEEIVKEKGLEAVPRKMIKAINAVAYFIDGKDLISSYIMYCIDTKYPRTREVIEKSFNLEEVVKRLYYYQTLFYESGFDTDKLMDIWLKVRSIENKIDPVKYPLDKDTAKKVLYHSHWLPKLRFALRFSLTMLNSLPKEKIPVYDCELDKELERLKFNDKIKKLSNNS